MSITALLVLAAAAATPAPSHGVEIASARVSVEILRPVIVRQNGGFRSDESAPETPRPQISRRAGTILVEFQ